MAKKKSRASRASLGGRQKANLAHEKKRQEKFALKRENGTAYEYKPNPYDKKSEYQAWHEEDLKRRDKAKSKKLPLARLTSIFAKLDNQITQDVLAAKEKNRR